MKSWGCFYMKRLYIILLFFTHFVYNAQNTNLLPDPGFEDTIICDIQYPIENMKYWYNPTENSPDAVLYCNDDIISSDMFKKHSGHGRAIIYLYYVSSLPTGGRDYVASPLKNTLKQNKKYCVDLYTIPSKASKYGCNSLGVYFGNGHQYYNTLSIPAVSPQADTLLSVPITDTSKWFHYMNIFTATGNETDIIVGNFKTDAQINTPIINNSPLPLANGAYFVFDDVSLHEMSINSGDTAVTCPQNMVATIGETNQDTAFKSYWWYDASGALIDSINSQIQVQPVNNTFYVQEKRMCGQSLWDTVFVKIDTVCPPPPPEPPVEEAEFVIPNVFSPNEDGINDVWRVSTTLDQTIENFVIYDRWGVSIVDSKNINFLNSKKIVSWDGYTTSGIASSDGVYYYIIELKNTKGEIEKYRGYITLLR
jgi:gliding motility-associated-like protein